MYLVLLAWGYVVVMMAVAEALSPSGTLLGAIGTLLLYGVLPMALAVYLLGTPLRRRARQRQHAPPATTAGSGAAPDRGGHAPGAADET
jgi:hypothetical protein